MSSLQLANLLVGSDWFVNVCKRATNECPIQVTRNRSSVRLLKLLDAIVNRYLRYRSRPVVVDDKAETLPLGINRIKRNPIDVKEIDVKEIQSMSNQCKRCTIMYNQYRCKIDVQSIKKSSNVRSTSKTGRLTLIQIEAAESCGVRSSRSRVASPRDTGQPIRDART